MATIYIVIGFFRGDTSPCDTDRYWLVDDESEQVNRDAKISKEFLL